MLLNQVRMNDWQEQEAGVEKAEEWLITSIRVRRKSGGEEQNRRIKEAFSVLGGKGVYHFEEAG